jgi:diacylglycerol kinase (ATP)
VTVRRARLVVNPTVLQRYPGSTLEHLNRLLRDLGIITAIEHTRAGTPVAPIVAAEAEDFDLFLVWGGDGTVADVATGLIGTGTPLGVLPAGTFNNIARALGLPTHPLAAARALATAQSRALDASFANGQLFLEVAGVGLDAAVMPFGERLKAHQIGVMLPAIARLVRYRAAHMTLDLDSAHGVQVHTPLVAVANGPFYGAGFTVAPDARWDDGRLTVRVFEGASVPELVWYFARIALHRRPTYTKGLTFHARRVRITSDVPLPVHADGHPIGTTPVMFESQTRALTVLVPAKPGNQAGGPATPPHRSDQASSQNGCDHAVRPAASVASTRTQRRPLWGR